MVVELGHFALILALCVALVQAALAAGRFAAWRAFVDGQRAVLALAQLLFVGIAFACLARAFLQDDFSVRLVAQHSTPRLPAWYKLSALWGNTKARCCCGCSSSPGGARRWPCSAPRCRATCARACCRDGHDRGRFYLFVLFHLESVHPLVSRRAGRRSRPEPRCCRTSGW